MCWAVKGRFWFHELCSAQRLIAAASLRGQCEFWITLVRICFAKLCKYYDHVVAGEFIIWGLIKILSTLRAKALSEKCD